MPNWGELNSYLHDCRLDTPSEHGWGNWPTAIRCWVDCWFQDELGNGAVAQFSFNDTSRWQGPKLLEQKTQIKVRTKHDDREIIRITYDLMGTPEFPFHVEVVDADEDTGWYDDEVAYQTFEPELVD